MIEPSRAEGRSSGADPRRMLIMLGVVSIGALLVLSFLAFRLSSEVAFDHTRQEVDAAAAATALAVEQELDGIADLVASYASRPQLVEALSANGGGIDLALLRFHLEALQSAGPVSAVAFVADPAGRLLDVIPDTPSIIGHNFRFRDWYRGVIETGQPYVSHAYETAAAGGGLIVAVAVPVRATIDPASQLLGILGAGYRLESIQQFVDQFSTAQGVAITVTDQRGVRLVSPGATPTSLFSLADDPYVGAALEGVAGSARLSRDGDVNLVAYEPITQLGWVVSAELSTGHVDRWSGLWTGAVAVVIILCLLVLVALAVVDRALRRRHRVEEELRRSQAFLDSVVENIPSMVFVKDAAELRYLKMNRAGEALLGHSRADLIGRNAFDLMSGVRAARSVAQDRDVLERGELLDVPAEWIETKDGQERILHTRKIPILGADGRPEYLLGIGYDVSEQHQAVVAVDVARQVADAANTAKTEFLSRMSHELRTPLNAVIGFGQLLQLDGLSADQRSSVDHIVSAGRHLLEMINEVFDLSRVERGELRMSIEPVSVSEVVGEAVGMMGPLAAARDVRIVVDLSPFEDTYVRADRQRFKQTLVNLLSNAVKYNREGGEVRISCQPMADNELRTTVTDTGIGIAEHDLARLFVPFERLGATKTDVEGTGLGLALTKRMVEAMAGAIGLTSTFGVGTSVWVDLPLVDAPSPSVHEPSVSPLVGVAPPLPLGPRTLLYIEDNVANVKLLERLVANRPEITMLVAMQGRLGLELARQHQPSLILLDLHLPDMAGDEVLLRLRSDESTRSIPVFVLSADASPGQVDRLFSAGATGYLTKPLDVPHLLDVIDTNGALVREESTSQSSEHPTLDAAVVASLHGLAAMSSDGDDQLREVVDLYLCDAQSRIDDLRDAANDGEIQRLGDVAHSLAGSSANFGAGTLAGLCARLHRDVRNAAIDEAPARVAEISTAFEAIRQALRSEFFDVEGVKLQ